MRYPRGNGFGVDIERSRQKLEIGKAEILRDGGDVAIVAYGSMVYPAVEAGEHLAKGWHRDDCRQCPIRKAARRGAVHRAGPRARTLIVTVEEAYLAGGFGSAVLELLEENGLADKVKRRPTWACPTRSSRTATRSCCLPSTA